MTRDRKPAVKAAETPTANGSAPEAQPVPADLTVRGVSRTPAEMWDTMLRFSGPTPAEQDAMRQTVDALFQRGYELVVATYDHLRHFPETAEVLGWQDGVDEAHLAERRRFFTVWLARTLSMDTGSQFGDYLFYAGKVHAAHGPRHIETPSMWVTGSVGLIVSAFAGFITAAHRDPDLVGRALAGWNKYLLVQLNQMEFGYEAGKAMATGAHAIDVKAYAMVRHQWGRDGLTVRYQAGERVSDVLRKLLNFAPEVRAIMFDPEYEATDSDQDLWMRVHRHYKLRPGWRVQLNGKNLTFHGGFDQSLTPGDEITLFSPGR
jgi:molybdopterin converting factor small subunit